MFKQARQGDVLLLQVKKLPKDAAPAKTEPNRIVLAYGEATGHAHAIYEPGAQLMEAANDLRFLVVESPVSLRHEEHPEIPMPANTIYDLVDQYEYTPKEIRRVTD